jgi:predicted DNA-binding ribbon-helix-helix protein
MKSSIVKRSVMVAGRKTSVSLEDAFWTTFREIADGRHMTLSELADVINSERMDGNLSSAIRLFVLAFYRNQLSAHQPPAGETRTQTQAGWSR